MWQTRSIALARREDAAGSDPMKPTRPAPAPAADNVTPQDAAVAGADMLDAEFKDGLEAAPYYSAGRHWDDYEPAYRFGRYSARRHHGRRFDEVEAQLEQEWDSARGQSRLGWVEARGAVEDAWSRTPVDETAGHGGPVGLPHRGPV